MGARLFPSRRSLGSTTFATPLGGRCVRPCVVPYLAGRLLEVPESSGQVVRSRAGAGPPFPFPARGPFITRGLAQKCYSALEVQPCGTGLSVYSEPDCGTGLSVYSEPDK